MKHAIRAVCVAIALIFVNGCYYVFSGQFKTMEKINSHTSISLYEKCSIYSMHMAIYSFGWVYSPEAAYANFLMALPSTKDTVYMHTDCWITPKVRKRLDAGAYGRMVWNGNPDGETIGDYNIKSPEHRAAILLNWCNLDTQVINNRECYTATCDYTYVVPSKTEFYIKDVPIVINENLFYELEKCGWLHSYKLTCYYEK